MEGVHSEIFATGGSPQSTQQRSIRNNPNNPN